MALCTPTKALSCSPLVVRNNGFCGRWRRQRFYFKQTAGEIFLDPMCLYSQYSEFCEEFTKTMTNTKKDFDPDPEVGLDLG